MYMGITDAVHTLLMRSLTFTPSTTACHPALARRHQGFTAQDASAERQFLQHQQEQAAHVLAAAGWTAEQVVKWGAGDNAVVFDLSRADRNGRDCKGKTSEQGRL